MQMRLSKATDLPELQVVGLLDAARGRRVPGVPDGGLSPRGVGWLVSSQSLFLNHPELMDETWTIVRARGQSRTARTSERAQKRRYHMDTVPLTLHGCHVEVEKSKTQTKQAAHAPTASVLSGVLASEKSY